ncbi:MAG: glutathione S-transferase family protein [Pseudomonadota bacterium]
MRLHQFAFSHFNEKARWALAWKGLPVPRQTYLPGPHMRGIRKLSGQTQTPVLETEQGVIAGSAAIIDWLEARYPEPALYPQDPALRTDALALQAELDDGFGPAVRRLVFNVLKDELGYLAAMFASQAPAFARVGYRAMLPLVRPLIVRGNGISEDSVAAARVLVGETLEALAERLRARRYLVGDCFSVADLTAAALLAPLVQLEHEDMARPRPVPPGLQSLAQQFEAHPVVGWVQDLYREHRAQSPRAPSLVPPRQAAG